VAALAPLYRRHSAGLAATYADLENQALAQGDPLLGSPGSITLRSNGAGARFYVRQYYDFDRSKRDQYIVAAGAPEADRTVDAWKRRIAEAGDVSSSVRLLVREGYQAMPPKHLATLAPLARHGLFAAGALLVGTHALGVILNKLGIRAASFATEDVDVARPARLRLPLRLEAGLAGALRESGIDFVEVPPLQHGTPSTQFKEQGRSRFTFDLLVPARGAEPEVVEVPELGVHAVGLPYFRYLIAQGQTGAALSTQGIVAVNVPLPERFALHKLVVSQLRVGRSEKCLKDRRQAATLIAALGEMHPGALVEAYAATPKSVRSLIRKSFEAIREDLGPHPQSLEEMAGLVAR
jgi:hypothetical protein